MYKRHVSGHGGYVTILEVGTVSTGELIISVTVMVQIKITADSGGELCVPCIYRRQNKLSQRI